MVFGQLPILPHKLCGLRQWCRINKLALPYLQKGCEMMPRSARATHDVSHEPSFFGKCVGNERAVTTPRHRLGTHDRRFSRSRDFHEFFQAFFKLRCDHVVRISTKRRVAPSEIY